MTVEEIKKQLAKVFDDDLETKAWYNILDYVVFGLILLSTIEIFLSTFEWIAEEYSEILNAVNLVTTIIFTVEVSLRIWCADMQDKKYRGFWGRVRYCFTFYGFIDIISTFPYYVSLFLPIPYVALKLLRTARLLRIFRYMPAFKLLSRAIQSKKKELLVSMQFVSIVTLILSFIFYFFEHSAQPEVFDNAWTALVWPFAKYLGEATSFVTMEPITVVGQIIAFIVGILGIAIVAIPAGLLGSAFIDIMDDDANEKKHKDNIEKIRQCFRHTRCKYSGYIRCPQYVSLGQLQVKMNLTERDIIEAIDSSDEFRIQNLAVTKPEEDFPEDRLVVEHFLMNKSYGGYVDRGSNVTIVSTSSVMEPGIGYVGYYLAKIGGFNYISRERILDVLNPVSYYEIREEPHNDEIHAEFMKDLGELASREDGWVIYLLSDGDVDGGSSFKYVLGDGKEVTIKDGDRFERFFKEVREVLGQSFGLQSDMQELRDCAMGDYVGKRIYDSAGAQGFTVRISWGVTVWDKRIMQINKHLAEQIAKHFSVSGEIADDMELSIRLVGEDYGYRFYAK